MQVRKPARLQKGDLIGIISPASPIADTSRIDRGVRYLERLGYEVVVGSNVQKTRGYLAGTDNERLDDLHAMFSDKRVRAIICVRGGYGTPRLLPLVNYRLIAQNPKILVGFSDITALQLAIWKKCRLITFHGPMLGVDMAEEFDPFTEEMFWRSVTSPKKIGTLTFDAVSQPTAIHAGKSKGRLLGGNLSLIISILGTPYQPDFAGSILFMEETAEEPYRIDRMITQLRNARVLKKTNAILAGQFLDCAQKDPHKPSLSLEEIFSEFGGIVGKPFLMNLPFGHQKKKMTIPVGLAAGVDASARTLAYLESAVR